MKRTKLKDRVLPNYTKDEEIANMVTHIVGGVLGIVVLVLCVVFSAVKGNVYSVVGSAIYGSSLIITYAISSIYHGLSPKLLAKQVFRVIDHSTIFILIAGTYTVILLCKVREYNESLGWSLFGIIWLLAVIGITLNAIDLQKFKRFSMICYLGMGWIIVTIFNKIFAILSLNGFVFLLLGGILYTIGAVLYLLGAKKKYYHTVFHIFVVLGSLCHFFCIFFYVIK